MRSELEEKKRDEQRTLIEEIIDLYFDEKCDEIYRKDYLKSKPSSKADGKKAKKDDSDGYDVDDFEGDKKVASKKSTSKAERPPTGKAADTKTSHKDAKYDRPWKLKKVQRLKTTFNFEYKDKVP